MRVISGTCRGRKLSSIDGKTTRPTSDRTREALFSILGHRILGARVLDLFAGTGALGIEALSRGAREAVFIDMDDAACRVLKKNLELCRMTDRALVERRDAVSSLSILTARQELFDLIFLDPPYDQGLIQQVVSDPRFLSLLALNGTVIAEHSLRENAFPEISGLDIVDQRKYGRTGITFFQPNGLGQE